MSAVLTLVAPATQPSASQRDADITCAVRRYCQRIGCDASNTKAAIAWALKSHAHVLQAIREGRQRATQLRARQQGDIA